MKYFMKLPILMCAEKLEIYTVNRKNTPKCFCHIFHKTQSILIKFGIHFPE